MIQKMSSWLIRHLDQTAVSYKIRGGGQATSNHHLLVAPFNENAAKFILFNLLLCTVLRCRHIKTLQKQFIAF
uniref:Uncharacterized protein n=1 Tax=Globodera pallida TaxID=36090 RepID=A0A183CEI2_GLOPA